MHTGHRACIYALANKKSPGPFEIVFWKSATFLLELLFTILYRSLAAEQKNSHLHAFAGDM